MDIPEFSDIRVQEWAKASRKNKLFNLEEMK